MSELIKSKQCAEKEAQLAHEPCHERHELMRAGSTRTPEASIGDACGWREKERVPTMHELTSKLEWLRGGCEDAIML